MQKFLILIIISPLIYSEAFAEVYNFRFKFKERDYLTQQDSTDYNLAFERAASDCFGFFKKNQKLSRDLGEEIIDSCANPVTTITPKN